MGSLWRAPRPLLLASASAVRRTLLEAAGLPVEIEAAGLDERAIEAGMGVGTTGREIALRLAGEKAAAVARRHPDRIVVGADQVLVCEGEIFAKPADPDAARRQIARLAGRTHALHSAVAIATAGEVVRSFAEEAHLTMRDLDGPAIADYVARAGGAALRSVGGYEIEGLGIHLFERIEGDHTTILGLPLLPLLAALRAMNLLAL